MGPIAYVLCQKPVIGLAMFVSSLCVFPPLALDVPVSLTTVGARTSISISVPVDKSYFAELDFEFPNADAMRADEIVGSRYDKKYCEAEGPSIDIPAAQLTGLGRPIPLLVSIRRKSNNAVVLERTFVSLCLVSTSGHRLKKSRMLGAIALTRGNYTVEIMNLEAQAGLGDVKTSFSLISGSGK